MERLARFHKESKEERVDSEEVKMCLSSYGLDQSEKVINWKHTFPLLFFVSRQKQ